LFFLSIKKLQIWISVSFRCLWYAQYTI